MRSQVKVKSIVNSTIRNKKLLNPTLSLNPTSLITIILWFYNENFSTQTF